MEIYNIFVHKYVSHPHIIVQRIIASVSTHSIPYKETSIMLQIQEILPNWCLWRLKLLGYESYKDVRRCVHDSMLQIRQCFY